MEMNKRGIYYIFDALLATILIIGVVILIIKSSPVEEYSSQFHTGKDLLNSLSALKISDIDDPFIISELTNGNIEDGNISVLEQIGRYWALQEDVKAEQLADLVLSSINVSNQKVTLIIGGDEIYDSGSIRIGDVSVARGMISGIDRGKPLAGTSASAYLRRIRDKRTSSYHYFGGFIGQGKISFFMDGLPSDLNVSGVSRVDNVYLEGDFQSNFRLYINGANCPRIAGESVFSVQSSDLIVDNWDLSHCTNLIQNDINHFEIVFTESGFSSSSVSGGFLRIDYRTDELQQIMNYGDDIYYFHGVEGVANIYDSFFIPGILDEMEIFLHFETNQTAYISVGERILVMNTGDDEDILNDVYHERDGDIFKVWIDNDFLINDANFDYSQLSQNNIPLRFAAYEVTSEIFEGGDADIVLITDFSGSMMKSVSAWDDQGVGVPDCGTVKASDRARKTHLARCLGNDLVDIVMNYTGNRLWPVFFHNNQVKWYNNPEDELAIKSYISGFGPQGKGETCIACAINQAYDILSSQSDEARSKFVVLMSDGAPTHCAQGSCNSVSTSYGTTECVGYCDTSGVSGCKNDEMVGCMIDDLSCLSAEENAIFSAQRLVDDFNVTIFTIGFGLIDECDRAGNILSNISVIGNGTYQHSSNTSELVLIYENISYEILTRIDQVNQSVNVQGDITLSTLFNDSNIIFNYTPLLDPPTPGKISVVFEELLDDPSCTNSIELYPELEIVEAEVISYSGPHWTDEVIVNNVTTFNLSDFYVPYVRLGDPFAIRLPVNLLHDGINNITIQTGDSPVNRTGCSVENKLVYTALLPSVTERTDSLEVAIGCKWSVETITGSYLELLIPEFYSGSKECFYNSSSTAHGDFDSKDAYDVAMLSLLNQLDPLNDGSIIVDLDASDLEIRLTIVGSIPYMWGPSIAEVVIS